MDDPEGIKRVSQKWGFGMAPLKESHIKKTTRSIEVFLEYKGSGQIRAKIYAKAPLILLQRDRNKIRRVFHTELTCYPPPAQSVAPRARRAFL
jgi:hypothetical protein